MRFCVPPPCSSECLHGDPCNGEGKNYERQSVKVHSNSLLLLAEYPTAAPEISSQVERSRRFLLGFLLRLSTPQADAPDADDCQRQQNHRYHHNSYDDRQRTGIMRSRTLDANDKQKTDWYPYCQRCDTHDKKPIAPVSREKVHAAHFNAMMPRWHQHLQHECMSVSPNVP